MLLNEPPKLGHSILLLCSRRHRTAANRTSSHPGGSLGWKPRGSLLPEFEKVAYELEPSTTANPKYGEVKTGEGYHIVMVEGRK